MRTAIWVLPALCVGFVLLWAMQAMIGMEGRLEEPRSGHRIEFVRLRRDTEIETKRREIPKKVEQEEPPIPELTTRALAPGSDLGDPMPIMDSSVDLGDAGGLAVAAGGDEDIVPLVRVEPIYPPRALQRAITGWVELIFTITAQGTVKNPRVTTHHPGPIFDRAALRAVRKWKYAPRVVDGKPVERTGVEVRLEFELDARQLSTQQGSSD